MAWALLSGQSIVAQACASQVRLMKHWLHGAGRAVHQLEFNSMSKRARACPLRLRSNSSAVSQASEVFL